ncbi:Panacea domain-containing protein [Campylobacter ureolyticus]|uniref:DUF4065 domain-containing protein n=1 Tax=Campylobacter ureolyticus TaxID=827 RepID=A0A9Q4PUD0_9BACT|nr:type II toxin-antitoxin system antitoxin SocA domain-containing protein [Campylobacter ureolyticus]MCZ6161977.1 DUF4065 domain-containing protein [Campylobacter ureolyticus]MCZ6170947.1 DUF4065 domain-containing protein [Campylobacter ureolyticus]
MKAQDLAVYIINRAIEFGNPVSNLKLQKILYFVNLLYLKKNKRFLISDIRENPFEAWQFGPVIENIYYKFSNYGGLSINLLQPEPQLLMDKNNKNTLDENIFKLISISPWTLVEWSHIKDGAWDKTYNKGLGNHQIIDEELIKQDAGL